MLIASQAADAAFKEQWNFASFSLRFLSTCLRIFRQGGGLDDSQNLAAGHRPDAIPQRNQDLRRRHRHVRQLAAVVAGIARIHLNPHRWLAAEGNAGDAMPLALP